MQAANDAGNLEDIREFTTPEMFGEIKMGFAERGQAAQQTDVVTVNAEVLDVTEESTRYIVSVRFTGLIREEFKAAAEPFDEIWHMVKPRDGSRGWTLAGIEQIKLDFDTSPRGCAGALFHYRRIGCTAVFRRRH